MGFLILCLLFFFGCYFGYVSWKVKEGITKLANTDIKLKKKDQSVGVTMGSLKPVEEPKSSATLVMPKTPQQIEDETREELRKQGYNV
jgi:hypothetical protein